MLKKDSFLNQCAQSSQSACDALDSLLKLLEKNETRKGALQFWNSLCQDLLATLDSEEVLKRYHFAVSKIRFQLDPTQSTELTLLQLPSTFAPEEWSYTFFEGLARYKPIEFRDRDIAELGCGIGWITLALALRAQPRKIYGLDINPKAILCSRINLYTNALDSQGKPTWLSTEGRSLLEVVEFHESDLLQYCRNKEALLDRVIGCIPQVLSPDPEFSDKIHARSLAKSDELLYSLSNYTADQGYVEDQFGLGLIARAVEESAEILRTSGRVILNLGGRPGTSVLNHLFLRRGFNVKCVWKTRVSQAKDTDIRGLVSIEEKTPHRFEFYMGVGSDLPVSAKTALAYACAGGEISHSLAVYEAELRDPVHVPKIIQFMRGDAYQKARNALDLSYDDEPLAVEKMSFLSSVAETFTTKDAILYEETAGLADLRNNLSLFFKKYYHADWEPRNFLITPSRASICENIRLTYRPKTFLIDTWIASHLGNLSEFIEVPRSSDLLCDLLETLKPEIAYYVMPQNEAETQDSFVRISQTALKTKTQVFLDISEWVDLSSTPSNNGMIRYLSNHPLPAHITLIGGLVKNRIYRDLEICFAISENHSLLQELENAAELTYSRVPVFSQIFYNSILRDLISFQIVEKSLPLKTPMVSGEQSLLPFTRLAAAAQESFQHPAISEETFARAPDLIRLDYGENTLPAPTALRSALLEAYSKKELLPEEADCTNEIFAYLRRQFSISSGQVTLGGGVAPLFSGIARFVADKKEAFIFPQGAYGHFHASAIFHNARYVILPTHVDHSFKLDPKALDEALSQTTTPSWVVLTAPIVNPTGAIYSTEEIEKLMKVVEKNKAVLVIDTIFSGLEFTQVEFKKITQPPNLKLVILGGISKEFAAGGLRFGYLVTDQEELTQNLRSSALSLPHATLRFACKTLYSQLLARDNDLLTHLNKQRNELKNRARILCDTLTQLDWTPLVPEGGLFLVARPNFKFDSDQLAEKIRKQNQVVINPPSWTGIPGYFRFVLSGPRTEFNAALKRLQF